MQTARMIRVIMDLLNEICDASEDLDWDRAYRIKDKLYTRVLTQISTESGRLNRADIGEIAAAALHAEDIIPSERNVYRLERSRV